MRLDDLLLPAARRRMLREMAEDFPPRDEPDEELPWPAYWARREDGQYVPDLPPGEAELVWDVDQDPPGLRCRVRWKAACTERRSMGVIDGIA